MRRAPAFLAVAGGVALLVMWIGGVFAGSATKSLGRADYVARLQRLCREADRKLANIPPPANLTNPVVVSASIDRVLPLLRRYIDAEQKLVPPRELAGKMDRAFELSRRSVRDLEEVEHRSRASDTRGVVDAMTRFLDNRDRARAAARAVGLKC